MEDFAQIARCPPQKIRMIVKSKSEMCATHYLEGYSDDMVVDPIKDRFPSCTMPLSRTISLSLSLYFSFFSFFRALSLPLFFFPSISLSLFLYSLLFSIFPLYCLSLSLSLFSLSLSISLRTGPESITIIFCFPPPLMCFRTQNLINKGTAAGRPTEAPIWTQAGVVSGGR